MNKYLMLHYLYHMEWCREIPVCVLDFVSVCVCVCERGGGASFPACQLTCLVLLVWLSWLCVNEVMSVSFVMSVSWCCVESYVFPNGCGCMVVCGGGSRLFSTKFRGSVPKENI